MKLKISAVLTLILFLLACPHGESAEMRGNKASHDKGGTTKMKTYHMGRFSIDIPNDMTQNARINKLRSMEIEEILIPQHHAAHQNALEKLWNNRLKEITALKPPRKKEKALIETRDLSEIGKWARGLFFHGNYVFDNEAQWNILLDAGTIGVWFNHDQALADQINSKRMVTNIVEIARAYQTIYSDRTTAGNCFHLEYGAIDISDTWEEKVFAQFIGSPLDLNLTIDMKQVETVEQPGLLERLAAAVLVNFVPGVKMDKIRSGKRTLAGLKGEEIIMRGTENGDMEIRFAWEYPGEEDSGLRPAIQITMESPDGNLGEKLKIWDAILDSFKPMYKTR